MIYKQAVRLTEATFHIHNVSLKHPATAPPRHNVAGRKNAWRMEGSFDEMTEDNAGSRKLLDVGRE
jgi:hypothetical protein